MTSQDKAAELLAAVRAVESGERSANSFFTRPDPGPARRPPAAPAARPAPQARAAGPVAVPEAVRAVLTEGGAPDALAPDVVAALGERADEVLRADPWQLLAVAAVRPEQADGFARALLGPDCEPGDERRAEALLLRALEHAAALGHTVLEPETVARELTARSVPDPDAAVREAIDAGTVLVFEDLLDALDPRQAGAPVSEAEAEEDPAERPVRVLLGLDRYALAEESLADGLARLASTFTAPPGGPGGPGAPGAAAWEAAATVAPPPAAELLRACAGHGLVTHTGGEAARAEPAALVAAARALGLRAYAVAHGEDSARRAARLVDAASTAFAGLAAEPASAAEVEAHGTGSGSGEAGQRDPGPAVVTVAGLLAGREGPTREEEGGLALDLLVVLDAPQLGTEQAATLVDSLPDGARLVLSGDPLLLGPAGPGQVFRDVLAARACPRVTSRTPDPGPVGELVSGIGVGELLQVAAPGREVVIVPVRDTADAVRRTVQLVTDSVPRALGIPVEQTQVITPGHGGSAGTRALNAALKERLNPGPGRFGGFDPGDRVAHSPGPGLTELATVVDAGPDGLRLDRAGDPVLVPPGEVERTVRHGWALTGHQAAALHRPAAVVVLPGDAAGALTREWVHTAFSRAGQHLSVVHGVDEALPRAVAEGAVQQRTTRLRTLFAQAVRSAEAEPTTG